MKRRKNTRKNRKKLTTEKVYELIMEENEYNPIVGTAFFETKQFLVGLGYTLPGAVTALTKVEREYDLNLYRRGNDHHHSDNGQVVSEEFGVTRNSNHRVYAKILIYYLSRIRSGMSKEDAIKACHEHYDPILAKDSSCEPQTEQIAMVVPKSLSASGRCKDLSDLDIEI